jgi:hypothetical protein
MRWKWIFIAPLAILAMLLFTVIGGEIVSKLWNWLLPPLFGWRLITFWQALGLLALCRIHGRWRMKERCGQLTPDERDRFRQRMGERFGYSPSTGESKQQ